MAEMHSGLPVFISVDMVNAKVKIVIDFENFDGEHADLEEQVIYFIKCIKEKYDKEKEA